MPGKALTKIGNYSALEWIVRRLRKCHELDGIVVNTTYHAKDDSIEILAKDLGISCFRGSENDLIKRLLGTATMVNSDALIRITGDCPLVDYELVDQMVRVYRHHFKEIDLVTNVYPRSYPDGLDVEILSRNILGQMDIKVEEPFYRECLTMYIYDNPDKFRILNIKYKNDISSLRWTLDYPQDLEFIRKIYSHFKSLDGAFTIENILEYQKSLKIASVKP